jgi:O-antigen ligase
MWLAHFALFRAESAIAWLGLVTVVENIVSSVAHSHLFDFNNGWLYVFAVGVLGGTILGARTSPSPGLLLSDESLSGNESLAR